MDSMWESPYTILLLIAVSALVMRPLIAEGDVYSRLPHGPGFRNVRDFGAKGDGITDDTAAFVRALEGDRGVKGHKSPANVYVPPGTYLLSDTLIVWRATLLAGDVDHPPTLVLKENSPGFDDPQNPKPMLVTAGGYNIDPSARDWRTRNDEVNGSTNNTFFITIRHLNLRIDKGNPGAWGIFWLVAQQTALRMVTIEAGEGQGCLKSMWWGGGGVISHLRCVGGDYGWHVQETSQWVLRSAEFRGQRKASLWLNGVWNFALLDLRFVRTAPLHIVGGAVSLIDSTFDRISGDSAIESEGADLVVQNTTVKGPKEVVKGVLAAKDKGKTLIGRWVMGDLMVDGQVYPRGGHDLKESGQEPLGRLPSPAYPRMSKSTRSVTEFGAKGDGKTDDTQAVQSALDTCRDVFFPEGAYLVSNTLKLRKDSRLFGEMWSVIELAENSAGFEKPESRKPLLGLPEDSSATVTICHLRFHSNTPGGLYCDWRSGERSMFLDSTFLNESQTQQLNWRISGKGGGFFENSWNPGRSGDGLEITSTGRKWIYAVQQEHYQGTALILRKAKHLVGLVLQSETSSRYVHIEDCEDLTLFQTIAGNWLEPVPALVHVVGGKNIALFNSAVTNAAAVISEKPHGWSAGASSTDRSFTRQTAWILGKSGLGCKDSSLSADEMSD